jgi:hypothetical protein
VPGLQSHHKRLALLLGAGRAVAPAPVIAHGLSRRFLLLAHGGEFFGRGVTAIGLAFGQQLFGDLAVTGGAGELIDHIAVPVQAHPSHAIEDGVHGFGGGAFAVGILDAQKEGAAGMTGIKPVEEGGAGAADMQHACGRGREAQDGFGVFGHDRRDLE